MTCSQILKKQGKPYPRTCPEHGLVCPAEGEFFAAFISDSYHVPGDERSRQCPGHGYPAHNVDFIRVERFSDEQNMLAWVEKQAKSVWSKPFQIVKCVPMRVEKKISISVE